MDKINRKKTRGFFNWLKKIKWFLMKESNHYNLLNTYWPDRADIKPGGKRPFWFSGARYSRDVRIKGPWKKNSRVSLPCWSYWTFRYYWDNGFNMSGLWTMKSFKGESQHLNYIQKSTGNSSTFEQKMLISTWASLF